MAKLVSKLISGIVHMRPLWALVLVTGSFVMSYVVVGVVLYATVGTAEPFEPSDVELLQQRLELLINRLTLPFAVLWLGWPVAISLYLNRTYGAVARVKPRAVILCYVGFLAAILVVLGYFVPVEQDAAFPAPLAVLLWIFAFFCPLYLMWSAARALVFVEEGREVGIDRRIGTFFLFYFLPLGIYFVQRRLQRMLNPRPGE